ncbi:MAG TPA: HlyD family secretion protein [Candidatus Acidoferrales bacterium]|nr:HlyD family secretion protein [Candidatus Acidoferrales bacterium]
MSASTETQEAPAIVEAPARAGNARTIVVRIILVVAAIAAITAIANRWIWSRTHVETDNAEIGGSVVPTLARVGGFVERVAVEDNQAVKAGDLLVQLDDREQKAKLAQAEADYAGALASAGDKGHTGQTEAQLAAARAQVVQAEANAVKTRADQQRYQSLARRNIVSQQQLDAANAAADAAAAALVAAQRQVQAAEAGWQGADARLLAARALRDQAELTLSYTRILAPLAGVVSRKTVELGQYVQPGQSLLAVVPLDDLYAEANLKETEIRNVRVGDDVRIDVDAYPGHPAHGQVESFSPATGASFSLLPPDNATGNYTHVVQHLPVRIRITDPGSPERPLRPGMSVKVTITTRNR